MSRNSNKKNKTSSKVPSNKNNKISVSSEANVNLSDSSSLTSEAVIRKELNAVTKENAKLRRDLSRLSYELRAIKKNLPASRSEFEFEHVDHSPNLVFETNRLRVVNLDYNESRSRTMSIIEHLNKYSCPDLYVKLGLNNLLNGYESLSVVYMLYSYFNFIITLYDEVRYCTDVTYVSKLSSFFEGVDMLYIIDHFSEIEDTVNLSDYDKNIVDSYNKLRLNSIGSVDTFVLPSYDLVFNDKKYICGHDIKSDYELFKNIIRDFRNPELPIFHTNRLFNDYEFSLDGDVIIGKDRYYEPKVVNGYNVSSIEEKKRESNITFYTSSDNIELKFIPRDSLVVGKFSLFLMIYDYNIEANDFHNHILIENGSNISPDIKNYKSKFNVLINPDLELDKLDSYLVLVNQNDEPFLYPSMMQLFIPGVEEENLGSKRMIC